MGVGDDFSTFYGNLTIDNRSDISARYKAITKRLNTDFWSSDSDVNNSLYVGSYGRDTAIRGFSDLDMLFELPNSVYWQYERYEGNGQSALLQAVRQSLLRTYSRTDIGADGQVVVVSFDGGMKFEVVPCFMNKDEHSFTYPDSNNDGKWKVTDPKPEIDAIATMDAQCNYNLKRLCRMMRAWKNEWSVPMGGLLIDTLAHNFIKDWQFKDKSFLYYDWMSRDFTLSLSEEDPNQAYWHAVGSNQLIYRKGSFEYKARQCYNNAVEAINHDAAKDTRSARSKWREIHGTAYPAPDS